MTVVPWAAQKESECSCATSQVSVLSRQSKAVAAFDLRLIEAKLAGGLSAGFLALKFTGEQLENFFKQLASRLLMEHPEAGPPESGRGMSYAHLQCNVKIGLFGVVAARLPLRCAEHVLK